MLGRVASLSARSRVAVAARARGLASTAAEDPMTMVFKSDHSAYMMGLYHKLNFALIGLGPLALVLSPSSLCFPVDLVLGVMIPLHGHIAGNDVISDYAKKITKAPAFDTALRRGLFGITAVTFFGLMKLNFQGPGITEAIKSLWKPKPKEIA